ncbi:hypothetical protein [Streptomyces sp.]|uniref:hypothetical protein n=1 Tax=Streptomyces sp. TaxID=1931 RepID=UPI002D79945B|nr:hypothetical protein [Streptomyces sp.]HET6357134.1 hypothetical protein [Streptomyces sp.]
MSRNIQSWPSGEAELTASDELPGLHASLGELDRRLVRDGANWLVARDGSEIRLGRISADPGMVFDVRHSWQDLGPASADVYVSPAPGGALAVSDRDSVTLHESDGRVRWTFPHREWPGGAYGACCPDPSGGVVLAVTPPPVRPAEGYAKEVCVALDLATGKVLAETELPSRYGIYEFQQALFAAQDQVFLNAAQGQTEAYSLLVSLRHGALDVQTVGTFDEPSTGVGVAPGRFLTTAVGGELLCLYDSADQAQAEVEPADVLPDGLVFMAQPGLLDHDRILTAAAEDPWGEDSARHFLLDATTLRAVAELYYPATVEAPPLPLGDGTWLTIDGDTVRRWQIAAS